MPRMLHWLWFGLAVCSALGAAYLTRFEPIPRASEGSAEVWDRWQRRTCLATPSKPHGPSLICSYEEAINANKP